MPKLIKKFAVINPRKTSLKTSPVIRDLIHYFGTQHAWAKCLGITDPAINRMVRRGRIPAKWAKVLEKMTKGKFTAKQICPEIFGD